MLSCIQSILNSYRYARARETREYVRNSILFHMDESFNPFHMGAHNTLF